MASGDVGILKNLFTGAALERQLIWQNGSICRLRNLVAPDDRGGIGGKRKAPAEVYSSEMPSLAAK